MTYLDSKREWIRIVKEAKLNRMETMVREYFKFEIRFDEDTKSEVLTTTVEDLVDFAKEIAMSIKV